MDQEIHKKKIVLLSRLKEEGVITLEESLLLLNEEGTEKIPISKNLEDVLKRYHEKLKTRIVTYPNPYLNNSNPYNIT